MRRSNRQAHDPHKLMLTGTWVPQSIELGGVELPLPDGRLVIAGSRYTMQRSGEADQPGHILIRTTETPHQIDFVAEVREGDAQVIRAIFRLRGDLLQIAYFAAEGGKRPGGFTSVAGSMQLVLRYRRVEA